MDLEEQLETALEELINGDFREASYCFSQLAAGLEEEEATPEPAKVLALLQNLVDVQ